MNVLVIYATLEGHSGKVAKFVADVLGESGHKVTLFDAMSEGMPEGFDRHDRFVLVAPVHERRHPKEFEVLVAARKSTLNSNPCLFLSVSLNAAFARGHDEAAEYVTEMCMRTGLEPAQTMLVPGAVRLGKYDYFAAQVLRHVVLRDRPYDPSKGSHDFTDWDALRAKVEGFCSA